MVKALHFKGDKKVKKRKRVADPNDDADTPASKALTTTAAAENDAAAEEDDSWVNADAPSDISGPIVVILPTKPITFLACDANGKVFCSEVENCVDGKAETAEPHDVRQVWVASRVAGTESLSLKGHHGRYLSVSRQGILSATATAISASESLVVLPTPTSTDDTPSSAPSTFAFQTTNSTYLGTSGTSAAPEIRGDATELSADDNTTFHIRMQARFKPRNKVAKAEKAAEKITRKELEAMVGRRLEDGEVRVLKRAKKEGDFHEKLLDFKVKGSHDKYA